MKKQVDGKTGRNAPSIPSPTISIPKPKFNCRFMSQLSLEKEKESIVDYMPKPVFFQ